MTMHQFVLLLQADTASKYVMEDVAACSPSVSGADDCGMCSALALSLGACWPGTYKFRCEHHHCAVVPRLLSSRFLQSVFHVGSFTWSRGHAVFNHQGGAVTHWRVTRLRPCCT
jgi:hypothetical protein